MRRVSKTVRSYNCIPWDAINQALVQPRRCGERGHGRPSQARRLPENIDGFFDRTGNKSRELESELAGELQTAYLAGAETRYNGEPEVFA